MFDEDGVDYTDYGRLKEYKENNPFNAETAKGYMEAAVAELCEADGVTLKGVTPGTVSYTHLIDRCLAVNVASFARITSRIDIGTPLK